MRFHTSIWKSVQNSFITYMDSSMISSVYSIMNFYQYAMIHLLIELSIWNMSNQKNSRRSFSGWMPECETPFFLVWPISYEPLQCNPYWCPPKPFVLVSLPFFRDRSYKSTCSYCVRRMHWWLGLKIPSPGLNLHNRNWWCLQFNNACCVSK